MSGKNSSRKYPTKDVKLLWGLSAGRCAFPDCQQLCIASATPKDDAAIIGQIAHIVAHSEDGPRSDLSLPLKKRDSYENWILLCSTHHDLVDAQSRTYTVQTLHEWKSRHEEWVNQRLSASIPSVGFGLLEAIVHSLINFPIPDGEVINFQLTNPKEKMLKNSLTDRIFFRLSLGLSKAREVQMFVEDASVLNPVFPEKLKGVFLNQYKHFREDGLEGDSLFEALHQFASPSDSSFEYQSAGLSVVAYLFEKCDIFER